KPLAASAQACRRMRAVYEKHNRAAIIGFTRRYESSWMRAYEIITKGTIGQPRMLLLRSVIPYFRYFERWHRYRKWSGGVLNEKSSHHFDALRWFAGSAPSRLHASGGRHVLAPRQGYPRRCSECDLDCPYRA